jgi:hypothetical protein
MNATADLNMSLLPATARFAIAVAVAVVLSVAWIAAEHESHDAVIVAGSNMSVRHVILPMVEIVGKRSAARTNA